MKIAIGCVSLLLAFAAAYLRFPALAWGALALAILLLLPDNIDDYE